MRKKECGVASFVATAILAAFTLGILVLLMFTTLLYYFSITASTSL